MIVVNPSLSINNISFLPRYYAVSSINISVYITNEDNRKDLTHNITNVIKDDGSIIFDTDAVFKKNTTYRLKVVDINLNKVIFMGKLFATTQSKQNYLING